MSTGPEAIPSHQETAQAMMIQLRQIATTVAGFAHLSSTRRRKITSSASLPDAFLQAVAVACDATPHLASSSQISGAEIRDGLGFSQAYTSVADELELLARGLRGTVANRRFDLGQRALRAYGMAKSINRPEDRELLIPHLADMKRTLGRGRRHAAAVPPAEEVPIAKPEPVK